MRRIERVTKPLNLTIHPSQFPETERAALMAGLKLGRIDPRLHYQSALQSRRWLKVFERWAPFVNSEDCRAIYQKCGEHIAAGRTGGVAVIALGCGDGSKDIGLLEALRESGASVEFVPLDVSASLVTRAALAARPFVLPENVHAIVADLVRATDLCGWLDEKLQEGAARIVTFYGMIPNFEPLQILPILAKILRPGDQLLFSANLASGDDLDKSVNRILRQYDNAETRAWLMTLLEEGGVSESDGKLDFSEESDSQLTELRRIVARFHFNKNTKLTFDDREFSFAAGADLRLFFSYRYSVGQIRELLERFGMTCTNSWITGDGEEGVFLCG